MRVHTVGHGTASADELLATLAVGGVRRLVDVRTAPGSRRHPQHARDELARWLPAAGVRYRWEPRLGGFRRPPPDSPDVALRNASFRGYAAHLRTTDARTALLEVLADAESEAAGHGAVAVMCSETVWWRCHRRLVADALELLHGAEVLHLVAGRSGPHRPTAGVRVAGDVLVYDSPPVPYAAAAPPADGRGRQPGRDGPGQ